MGIIKTILLAGALLAAMAGAAVPTAAYTQCTPSVGIKDAEQRYEGQPLVFEVTMTTPPGCTPNGTVSYSTVDVGPGGDDDATVPSDYDDIVAEKLVWSAGQVTKVITVPVVADDVAERNEELGVLLHDAQGITIVDGIGVGRIVNDERLTGGLRVIKSTPVCHPAQGCWFVVELSEVAQAPVTVDLRTADGTARSGTDFTPVLELRMTIPAGAGRAEFVVRVLPNATGEPDERFTVLLTGISAGRVGTDRIEVTIPAGAS